MSHFNISQSSPYFNVHQSLNSVINYSTIPNLPSNTEQQNYNNDFGFIPSESPVKTPTFTNKLGFLTNENLPQQREYSDPDKIIWQPLFELEKKYKNVLLLFPHSPCSSLHESQNKDFNSNFVVHWKSPDYARLPCDYENTKPKGQHSSMGQLSTIKVWDLITKEFGALNSLISSSVLDITQVGNQIQLSVSKYNVKAVDYRFNLLNQDPICTTLRSLFSSITDAALEIRQRFPFGIPILRKHVAKTLFFTQAQIKCILANAFFCTFPKRLEYPDQELPEINFLKLFDGGPRGISQQKFEKLLCVLHYFSRVNNLENNDGTLISFERRQLPKTMRPCWQTSDAKMSRVAVHLTRVEDAESMLQVDFGNKFVGGGIIGKGLMMEEILFSICSELIAARLFTETLGPDEVLICSGCQQFSKYSGYAETFKFKGNHNHKTELDKYGRKDIQVVVVDACKFQGNEWKKQFEKYFIDLELNKCYCAFRPHQNEDPKPIATGKAYNGVFNGDEELKFIIQWMAASQASQRKLHYFTAGDKQQADQIMHIVKFLERKETNVGKIYKALENYFIHEIAAKNIFKNSKGLFQFLEKNYK